MKKLLVLPALLLCGCVAQAQVFMRPFDNAAALSMGGATIAYPGLSAGVSNEAMTAWGDRAGVFLGSALPYNVGGWQSVQLQGFARLGKNDGAGLDIANSAIETYGEQRFRFIYGRRLGDNFLLGGSVDVLRLWQQDYGNYTGLGIGLAFMARPTPRLTIAGRIQNPLQRKIEGEVASTLIRIGLAWKTSESFVFVAETEKDLERRPQLKAGFEYRPVQALVVRAGMRGYPARISLGAGVRFKQNWSFELGSEWHSYLGLTPAAMLVWRR